MRMSSEIKRSLSFGSLVAIMSVIAASELFVTAGVPGGISEGIVTSKERDE